MEEQLRLLASEGIEVLGPIRDGAAEILTPEALRFVAKLVRRFSATRDTLLRNRVQRQEEINAGRYRFDEAQNFGWNQLAKLGNVVNGVPAGSQSYRPYTWKDSAEAAGNLGQGAGGLFGG